jgi:hypothetical protein
MCEISSNGRFSLLKAIFVISQKKEPIQDSYFMFVLLLFCVTYLLDALLVAAMKNCTQGEVPRWQEQNQIYNWMISSQTPSILPNLLMIMFCYNTSNHSPIYTTTASSILLLVTVQIGIHLPSLFSANFIKMRKKKKLGAATPTRFFWRKIFEKNSKKARFLNQI